MVNLIRRHLFISGILGSYRLRSSPRATSKSKSTGWREIPVGYRFCILFHFFFHPFVGPFIRPVCVIFSWLYCSLWCCPFLCLLLRESYPSCNTNYFCVSAIIHDNSNSWIKGNPGYHGFYIVNYDNDNWNALKSQLISDHEVRNNLTRYLRVETELSPNCSRTFNVYCYSGVQRCRSGWVNLRCLYPREVSTVTFLSFFLNFLCLSICLCACLLVGVG